MRRKGRETKQNKPVTTVLVAVMDILQWLSGTSGGHIQDLVKITTASNLSSLLNKTQVKHVLKEFN